MSGAATALAGRARILLLGTGGTIAGKQREGTARGYTSGSLRIDRVLAGAASIGYSGEVQSEEIAAIASQNINSVVWAKLYERIVLAFGADQTDAIVITHGTDTLEETAYLLNLLISRGKPIVLVGSMRPADAPDADGPLNLSHAIALAGNPASRDRGVLCVIGEDVHEARSVYKARNAGFEAFRSFPGGPVGKVSAGTVSFFKPPSQSKRREYTWPFPPDLPVVEILYCYAGMRTVALDAAISAGARGIVLAGVGSGNAPDAVIDALAAAAREGVTVVRAARMNEGDVQDHVELDDARLGFVVARYLNPQKSRLLLQILLANGVHDPVEQQQAFDSN